MKLDAFSTSGTCDICGKRRSKGDHTKCSMIRKEQNQLALPPEGTNFARGKANAKNCKLDRFKVSE